MNGYCAYCGTEAWKEWRGETFHDCIPKRLALARDKQKKREQEDQERRKPSHGYSPHEHGPPDPLPAFTGACPFCEEPDFDLIGLKGHIDRGECDSFNHIKIDRANHDPVSDYNGGRRL